MGAVAIWLGFRHYGIMGNNGFHFHSHSRSLPPPSTLRKCELLPGGRIYLARCTHIVSVTPGKPWPSQATPRPRVDCYCHDWPAKQPRDRGLIVTIGQLAGHPASCHRCSRHPASCHRCSRHPANCQCHRCSRHATRHRCSKHSAGCHRCSKHPANPATHANQPRHHGGAALRRWVRQHCLAEDGSVRH